MANKKALMIQRTQEYLELHRASPAEHPLNVEAVAAFVPVSRRLFYKDDADIAALLDLIRPVQAHAPATSAVRGPEEGAGDLSDDVLQHEISRIVARAVWAMQRFVGHHKDPRGAGEAALAAHDLDEAIGALTGCQRDLRPLAAEQLHDSDTELGDEQHLQPEQPLQQRATWLAVQRREHPGERRENQRHHHEHGR
ncbi:MAG: hypothetical protein KY464_09415, partial [Gemmatimonadetes bacterium]|nr:hypothetical protein [Gemmatimonadota bacterium]